MIVRFTPISVGRLNGVESICSRCLRTLSKSTFPTSRRHLTNTPQSKGAITASIPQQRRLRDRYFLANAYIDAKSHKYQNGSLTSLSSGGVTPIEAQDSTSTIHETQDLPHRRRQRAKKLAKTIDPPTAEPAIPPDASSTLSSHAQSLPTNSLRRLFSTCLSLTKPRLSFLVVLSATASYAIFPVPDLLSPSLTHTPSLSTLTLFFLTSGTFLAAASANTFNMLYEPKWDAMMSRTKNRPLVRGLISPLGALIFAITTGIAGTTALYYGVNPTVSFLGALNILLYAGLYTPLKRVSAINTWVGAIVGGIPPLMGWAAAAGQTATGSGDWQELLFSPQSIGGWLLAGVLFAWQFPHFMALSYNIRNEYKLAGHQMLCWINPNRNGRVAVRYAVAMVPLCLLLCSTGVTEWAFAVTSAPLNVWMIREAVKFWWLEGAKGSARGLFWASVWHLPVLMVMAMLEKKGLWQRIWRAAVGEGQPDEEDDWVYEDDEDDVVVTANQELAVLPKENETSVGLAK